ncbi:MAG: hypothetical protein ABI797_00615 [Chloroflexota bacterium]
MKLLIVGGSEADVVIARAGLPVDWTVGAVDRLETEQPDVVYTPSVVPAGLAVAAARRSWSGPGRPWLSGVSGVDLMADYQEPTRAEEVTQALRTADGLLPHSDGVAKKLKSRRLEARIFPVTLAADALQIDATMSGRKPAGSSRRTIAIDGGHGLLERGQVALAALRMVAQELSGHDVAVLNAGPDVALAAELLAADTGLRVTTVAPEATQRDAVLRILGQALIAVHVSLAPDVGSWESAALAQGAVPIVSAQSTLANEWPREAVFVPVDPEDPREIAAAITRVVNDRKLVDRARSANAAFTGKRLDANVAASEIAAAIVALAATGGR